VNTQIVKHERPVWEGVAAALCVVLFDREYGDRSFCGFIDQGWLLSKCRNVADSVQIRWIIRFLSFSCSMDALTNTQPHITENKDKATGPHQGHK
jgi:hypothetical protein